MPTLADRKISQMQQVTGETRSNLTDLEWDFYSANSGLSPANKYSISDHKLSYFKLQGAAGKSLPEVEKAFFTLMGAQGANYDDLAYDFYTNLGFGPGSINGLAAWYDASSISGTVIAKDTFDRSKNLVGDLDPSNEISLQWANQSNASVALSSVQKHSGNQSVAVTAVAGGNATAQLSTVITSRMATPGATYTHSIWVFNATAAGRSIQADLVSFYTTAGRQDRFNTVTALPGVWTRISVTWTNPAGDTLTNASMTVTMQGATAADIFYVDDFQVELGSQATPFVWGDATHLGVSDSGHVWTTLAGTWGVSNNSASVQAQSVDDQRAVIDTGTLDHTVTVDFNLTTQTGSVFPGIVVRGLDVNNHYMVQYQADAHVVTLYKKVAGAYTLIQSQNTGLANYASITLTVSIQGTSISVLVNNIQVINVTDASLATGTLAGLRHGSTTSNTNSFKNFSVKTPIYSDGAALPIWPDISGNYRHATQPTAGLRPLFRTASQLPPTGKPTIQFDSNDDVLSANGFSQPIGTTFVVAKKIASRAGDSTVLGEMGTASNGLSVVGTTDIPYTYDGTTFTNFSIALDTNYHVIEMSVAAGVVTQLIDGANSHTGSYVKTFWPSFGIGGTNGAVAPNMAIAAVLIFNRALSTNERQRVERYLKARYGTP